MRSSALGVVAAIVLSLSWSIIARADTIVHVIFFEFGSQVPGPMMPEVIRKVLKADRMKTGFVIAGHTDRVGDEETNILLSCRRAEAVRDFMVARGVPPHHIVLHDFGEARPRRETADSIADPENRRVEITYATLPISQVGRGACT